MTEAGLNIIGYIRFHFIQLEVSWRLAEAKNWLRQAWIFWSIFRFHFRHLEVSWRLAKAKNCLRLVWIFWPIFRFHFRHLEVSRRLLEACRGCNMAEAAWIYSSDTSGGHLGMEHSKKLQVLQQKYLHCDRGYGSFLEAVEAESWW